LLIYHTHLSLLFTIDALATGNARILSLEAELKASRRAFDAATTAKTSAEKSSKSALDKVKKMEKSLADLNKERTQRDQAVALRINNMSALTGGKYHALSSPSLELLILILH
jgi:chromosome segregation ATPase